MAISNEQSKNLKENTVAKMETTNVTATHLKENSQNKEVNQTKETTKVDIIEKQLNGTEPNNTESKPENSDKVNQELVDEALELRDRLKLLVSSISKVKRTCEKLEHENQNLQDYVGYLMSSGSFIANK
ncbi:Slo1p ASCRUDRAFT_71443 [Ascoidea rubescens DSM 1968]|uniref:Uncharacterized protein n=1 Tax=Ascoidea rubescens DSM 1968 TaxID=1344418 RepID=A0A1D2VEP6_9ASCO|nr:hypothetical protein ASCRUDRAFT_71443 [Ascoidea rubescens DSM 1968]ODV59973.1 hypothetical protein ASCRUDRAFT_71443 [Ascoidea rubescens DSM 1968]